MRGNVVIARRVFFIDMYPFRSRPKAIQLLGGPNQLVATGSRDAFVSVLLLAHAQGNRSYLREAIESLAHQTLPRDRYEVLFVKDFDDAEIDRQAAELGFLQVRTPPGPVADKVLAGFRASRGEVITFLDYDDRYARERLTTIVDAFERDTKLGYLHDGVECIDPEGRPSNRGLSPVFLMMAFSHARITIDDPRKAETSPRLGLSRPDFHGMSVRRPVMEFLLPYLGRVRASVDTLLYNASWTFPLSISVEPRKLYQYRTHAGSTSLAGGPSIEATRRLRQEWRAASLRDYAVIRGMVETGGRKELIRDLDFRMFSDHLLTVIKDDRSDRRSIWRTASNLQQHLHRTNWSPLFVFTGAYIVVGLAFPSLARRFAGIGE